MKPTSFNDVNKILDTLVNGLQEILNKNLIGVYLTGSLTYGDFDKGSSDIDFLVVMEQPLSLTQRKNVTELHTKIGITYPQWRKRIEGSYITIKMLTSREPPKEPRPYINAGKMWNLVYGHEWIINLYSLYNCGVTLFGPDPKELFPRVDITDIRSASKKILLEEWQPKLKEPFPFKNNDYDRSHLQAYAILTMCRVLYLAFNEHVASKKIAAEWTRKTFSQWDKLIENAENWKDGLELNLEFETKAFIQFVID